MQLGYWYRKYDQTGKYVYPSERHVIKKYKNSYGDVVKIYDTDEERTLDEVYNEYYMYRDIVDMLDVAQERKYLRRNVQTNFSSEYMETQHTIKFGAVSLILFTIKFQKRKWRLQRL